MGSRFNQKPKMTTTLESKTHVASQTLPYDAMEVSAWSRRNKVVAVAPTCIQAAYIPLASTPFRKLCGQPPVMAGTPSVITMGDLGLSFALDETQQPVMSVESAALFQIVQSETGAPEAMPTWLRTFESQWASGMCMFMYCKGSGWRGCFAEHRLWSTCIHKDGGEIKTAYCTPTVRGWFPQPILADLRNTVGSELLDRVAETIFELGFDGSPDLVLWNHEKLLFVEVKSATDRLRNEQARMMKQLARIPGVECRICCPACSRKRLATEMAKNDDTTDEED